ncbi:hypothetical protein ACHAQH_007928 [Verticillium albo-atrum]
MSHRYPQLNELPVLSMEQSEPAWSHFDFSDFSDFSIPDASDTVMQQMSDDLLLEPLLDLPASSPAGTATQSNSWDWSSHAQQCLPEYNPNHPQEDNNLEDPSPQESNEALEAGAGGETINVGREVLDFVRKAAQFEELVKHRLAKIEEALSHWEDRYAEPPRHEIDASIEKLKTWVTEVQNVVQEAQVRD